MSTYAIHAQRFVLPGRLAQEGYVTVCDGLFGTWSKEQPNCELVELGDSWVGPGLIDTHIHGYFGHATTDKDPQGINQASIELARQGTTAWLPTTFTDADDNIAAQCEAIVNAIAMRGDGFMGARIPGIYLEGPFFTEKHKGAQNPAYLKAPSYECYTLWQSHARGRIIKSALAPEYEEATDYITRLAADGVVTALGHSDARFEEGMAAVDAGATVFVHTYNGMSGLHHRDPGLVGCAMASPATYAELICDGHHVAPGACAALIRAKGWEHVVPVSDCLGCGGLPDGAYMSGGLPIVLKDGLCYLENMQSIAGSVITLAQCVKNLVDWGIVSAEQALRMGSEVSARSVGIDDQYGYIAPGRLADFNVYAPDLTLRASYIGGELVPTS
ncbi:MAG: N-acetylglucosamine-6-phosphate deacetylase [Atopobiaceae bacterium]|nr:N-acetylglucosamine-6-phosphate deacetylase [Atopobiaceae bacterium]